MVVQKKRKILKMVRKRKLYMQYTEKTRLKYRMDEREITGTKISTERKKRGRKNTGTERRQHMKQTSRLLEGFGKPAC